MSDKYKDVSDRSDSDSVTEYTALIDSDEEEKVEQISVEEQRAKPSTSKTECLINVSDSEDRSESSQRSLALKPKKRNRKSYSLKNKLKAIDFYHTTDRKGEKNACEAARNAKVNRTTFQGWLSQEEELRKAVNNRNIKIRERRQLIAKRKGDFPEVDKKVFEWFQKRRELGLPVTSIDLMDRSMEAYNEMKRNGVELPVKPFKGTWGWLKGFLKRYTLTSRMATSVGQKIPNNAKDLISDFFKQIEKFRQQDTTGQSLIMNEDEMPMYFDSPTLRTYDKEGTKTVAMKSTGHEKTRFTLMLCAANDGRKCRPAIIFKGLKKVPKQKFPKGIDIMVADKGSINKDIMSEWKRKSFGQRPGGIFLNSRMSQTGHGFRTALTMDSATPHMNLEFRNSMAKNYGTKVIIIPGGLTPLVQPADVSWNRSIKSKVRQYWVEWKASPKTPEELNKSGEPKRASYSLVAEWCLKAWQEMDSTFIIRSFEKCGLGKTSDDTLLNHKLLEVITGGPVIETEDPEDCDSKGQTGQTEESDGFHTDIESESEEMIETIDFDE